LAQASWLKTRLPSGQKCLTRPPGLKPMMQANEARAKPLTEGEPLFVGAGDTYFEGEPGVIAAFDFNYDDIVDFETKLKCAQISVPCVFVLSSLCCTPCFLKQNVEWKARAQHVAVTVDGIRYCVARHPSACGLSCTDVGKESKTVPYDKITDCDVQEPAGMACCCCIQNVLSTVNIDTASSGVSQEGVRTHELSLTGLRFPHEFKRAVWAMKRGDPIPSLGYEGRPVSDAPNQMEMHTRLLTEIRDELRDLNGLLRAK